MVITIVIMTLLGIGFIAAVSYLIYLKANGRDIDEDDCHIRKRHDLKAFIATQKAKERKLALKKKRELEKLDRMESKRRQNA